MDPKAELLVFNKKEIIVIITLLVLVALFSFTLGLKLGKTLGGGGIKTEQAEHAPLVEHEEKHVATESEHGEEPAAVEPSKKINEGEQPKHLADDHADAEFTQEADKEKVGSGKVVPMALPKDKKSEGPRYTLQVGSHRTVAEATEQVAALKHKGLDAFYLEAQLAGKGTWYRVGVGVFAVKEEAERAATAWKSKGLPAFIVQKLGE